MTRAAGSAPRPGGHVQAQLGAYLLGGLSAAESAAVRAHLSHCATCRAEHDDLALVPALLGLLPAGEVPGGLTWPDDLGEDREPGEPGGPPCGSPGARA
jgi:hypothetical protein